MKKENTVENLAFELEHALGIISLRVETLDDISTNLKHLQGDMDNAVFKGIEKFAYAEHHREVRILAELMYWTMQELQKNYKEAAVLSTAFLAIARPEIEKRNS